MRTQATFKKLVSKKEMEALFRQNGKIRLFLLTKFIIRTYLLHMFTSVSYRQYGSVLVREQQCPCWTI
jgi:hypothetical protein